MKRYTMIATMAAALAGLWIPAHAQIAAIEGIAALNDNGKEANTAAQANAAQSTESTAASTATVGTRDTVYVMEKWHHHAFRMEEGASQLWREKGYGVGGGFTPAVIGVNTRPFKEIINEMEITKGRTFNFNSYNCEAIYVSGGVGYLGVGNGVRIGVGGLSGERNFSSEGIYADSAVALKLHIKYGGFLVEKAFVRYKINYLIGGYIGGGTMTVNARFNQAAVYSTTPQGNSNAFNSVTANFFLAELHGGVTYSILPWLHTGADIAMPLFFSADGFQGYTPSFVTVNPAFRARLMLGNLG
jgi:hypothetical protein